MLMMIFGAFGFIGLVVAYFIIRGIQSFGSTEEKK